MARRDLEKLRAKISGLAESAGGSLSMEEKYALQFAGEDRLREIAGFFDAILDAQIEWEEQQDSGVDDEPDDYGGGSIHDEPDDDRDYGDDDYDYDEGYWEIEATFDYGDNI